MIILQPLLNVTRFQSVIVSFFHPDHSHDRPPASRPSSDQHQGHQLYSLPQELCRFRLDLFLSPIRHHVFFHDLRIRIGCLEHDVIQTIHSTRHIICLFDGVTIRPTSPTRQSPGHLAGRNVPREYKVFQEEPSVSCSDLGPQSTS